MSNSSTVILIVAHGSRNPRAAEEHSDFCDQVARHLGDESLQVRPAYLEITEPSVPTAITRAIDEGATSIHVLPHFLNSGNHVLVDLPAIVEAERARHPGVAIDLAAHLGANPGLVGLTVELIDATARTRDHTT